MGEERTSREYGLFSRTPSALETHIQTVLAALVVAILVWMGQKVTMTSETLAALRAENSAQISKLQDEMFDIKGRIDRSFSLRDSLRELSYRDAAITSLNERVRYLERQVGHSMPPWTLPVPEPLPEPPYIREEVR